jgi:hypothetical protein
MPGEVYDSKRLFAIARKEVLFHVRVVGEGVGFANGSRLAAGIAR